MCYGCGSYVVDKTGRVAKTHSGVRSEFLRPAKDDPLIVKTMAAFLPEAYPYKEIGDYGVKPNQIITIEDAAGAVASAAEFLGGMRAALA